jgi:hypothetical protein
VFYCRLEPEFYVLFRAASLVKELREPNGIIGVMASETVRGLLVTRVRIKVFMQSGHVAKPKSTLAQARCPQYHAKTRHQISLR